MINYTRPIMLIRLGASLDPGPPSDTYKSLMGGGGGGG